MAAAVVILEEIMTRHRNGEDSEIPSDGFDDRSARELSIEAIKATASLAKEVGRLAGAVTTMEERLAKDYKTADRQELDNLRSKDKWFKRLVTGVVTAVAIGEAMHWLGLGSVVGGH